MSELHLPVLPDRPRTRADCLDGGSNAARPCGWSGCRHHLDSYADTCSLDVADRVALGDELTLDAIGQMIGLTRERVRQLEAQALRRLAKRGGELAKYRSLGEPE